MAKLDYAIDTALVPEVWVTWLSKNGRIWMDGNGNRQNRPACWMDYNGEHSIRRNRGNNGKIPFGHSWYTKDSDKLWVASGSNLYYAYAKYHEDIDRLELAAVRYDTTRGEGKHTWMYAGDRLFIGKDKSVVDQFGNEKRDMFHIKKDTVESVKGAMCVILRCDKHPAFIDEFKKFIGHNYFIIGNGTSVTIERDWHLTKWFTSKQRTRSKGKPQKLVDELVKMPLGSIDGLEYKYTAKAREHRYSYESKTIKNIIYFERINDKWSVLRALIREENGSFDEVWRVYLGDDGTNCITTKSNGDWVPSNQHSGWEFRSAYYFANADEAKEKCNRIKYIAPIMSTSDSIEAFLSTLRFPCIEQLYKLGYTQMALGVANSSTPKAYMRDIFGGYYNEKEKSLLRQVGMTKYQLDAYCRSRDLNRYSFGGVLQKMREALGDDLSHIDNATFDKYYSALTYIVDNVWSLRCVDRINMDKSRFWRNVVRLYEKNHSAPRIIGDTISMYGRLDGNKPNVNWIFEDYSDIVRVHDALTALINEQEAEYRARWNMSEAERRRKDEEKRRETDEKRKHYEYEDEDFIIRLPKDVYEIITEGAEQSICIGGYTTRHSKGDTNLFFLRRKSDVNTPFYAIEMNNNKTIVQIHGSCNKWLGNNPEAIPTVVRWMRKHNIKCDKTILTCTAKGYGRRNEYIEMPKVD